MGDVVGGFVHGSGICTWVGDIAWVRVIELYRFFCSCVYPLPKFCRDAEFTTRDHTSSSSRSYLTVAVQSTLAIYRTLSVEYKNQADTTRCPITTPRSCTLGVWYSEG